MSQQDGPRGAPEHPETSPRCHLGVIFGSLGGQVGPRVHSKEAAKRPQDLPKIAPRSSKTQRRRLEPMKHKEQAPNRRRQKGGRAAVIPLGEVNKLGGPAAAYLLYRFRRCFPNCFERFLVPTDKLNKLIIASYRFLIKSIKEIGTESSGFAPLHFPYYFLLRMIRKLLLRAQRSCPSNFLTISY